MKKRRNELYYKEEVSKLIRLGREYFEIHGTSPKRMEWEYAEDVLYFFGFWNSFLEAADLPLSKRSGKRPRTTKFGFKAGPKTKGKKEREKKIAIKKLQNYYADTGIIPQKSKWRGIPGLRKIVSLFGAWDDALEEAGLLLPEYRQRHCPDTLVEFGLQLIAKKKEVQLGEWINYIKQHYSCSASKCQYAMRMARMAKNSNVNLYEIHKKVIWKKGGD